MIALVLLMAGIAGIYCGCTIRNPDGSLHTTGLAMIILGAAFIAIATAWWLYSQSTQDVYYEYQGEGVYYE